MGPLAWGLRFLFYFSVARLTQRLAKINLSVTSVCNSRCKTCDIWKEPKRSRETDLRLEDYSRLFRHSPKSVCWLSLTGGEPFLREDLAEIVAEARHHFPRLRLLSITTNALDATSPAKVLESILQQNPALRIYLNISLDGHLATHDHLRGMPGNFLSCLALRENLRPLQESHRGRLKVTFETTVSRENLDQISTLGDLAKSRKALHIFTVARTSNFYKHRLRADNRLFLASREIVEFTRAYIRQMRPTIGFDHIIRRALYAGAIVYHEKKGKHPVPCAAGKNSVWVGPKGNVSPCIHWSVELGNAREKSLGDILAGGASEQARKAIAKQQCPGCWTPCEATQSLLASPIRCAAFALSTYPRSAGQKAERKKPWLPLPEQPGLKS